MTENLLRNPSFELGWTDDGNRQIPNGWDFWYDEDTPNPYDPHPHSEFGAPELRVLTIGPGQLPEHERDLFILDGDYTLKIFRGAGAWFGGLKQSVELEPGQYHLATPVFADLVKGYADDGEKIWADDPKGLDGLFAYTIGNAPRGDWQKLVPGTWNDSYVRFDTNGGLVEIAITFMLPFALENSGIFVDNWELVNITEPEPDPEPDPEPIPCRGAPREQYARTYHVLPPDATWEQASGVFKEEGFENARTVGYSYDDAGLGDLDDRTAVLWGVPDFAHTEYSDWYDKWYPGVKIEFRDLLGEEPPPPPPPPPEPKPSNTTKVGFHLQRPFDGCLDLIKRCADAGKPMAWVKVVQEHLEIIEQVKALSPDTKCMYRYIPRESPAYFIHAPDYWQALNQSTFKPMFDRAVELGYDAVETPVNEVIGTHNPDIVMQNVSFDAAYCYWCRDRSGDRVAPAIITPGGGNPDHGYETTLLIPAARAVLETDGILVPHTYFTVRPEPGISEEWMHSAQVQYDYHLRPVLSWFPTLADAGIDVSKLRLVFGECGAVGAHKNAVGLPGGYKDAGAGWRRYDALNGDLSRYVNLLADYEALCQLYQQIEGWVIFTQGHVGWEHFQFNEEFSQLFDVLLEG